MKFTLSVALAGALSTLSATGEFQLNNGIAAVANDSVITHQDLLRESEAVLNVYRRTYVSNPEVFRQKRDEAMSDALDQLIDQQLILTDFKTLGGIIQESWIDDNIKERIREQFGDRVTFTKSLQAQGITYEAFRQRERDKFISMLMARKHVLEPSLISPSKIERFYQTNLHRFKLGDQVKLRIIQLGRGAAGSGAENLELALDIKKKITEGASFSEMASTYSEQFAKEGGLWGWKEYSQLKLGLAEIAFGLEKGKSSRVLSVAQMLDGEYWVFQHDDEGKALTARKFTERGSSFREAFVAEQKLSDPLGFQDLPAVPRDFYILFAEEKQPARVRVLEEVRDEIEKELILQERARLQKRWIDRLRAKSFVRYF